MTERGLQTRDLLRSMLDYLPGIRSSAAESVHGAQPSRWAPCSVCAGRGRTSWQNNRRMPCPSCAELAKGRAGPTSHGCELCLGCDGFGYRRARVSDDPWDDYVGELGGPAATRCKTLQEIESELLHIGDMLAEHDGRIARLAYAWERSKRRQWKHGSYSELDRALQRLRDRYPGAHSLVWKVEVCQLPIVLSEKRQQSLEIIIGALALQLPDPIRVPVWVLESKKKESLARGRTKAHEQARGIRNSEMRELFFQAGWKKRRIADRYGVSVRRLNQILAV